MRYPIAIVFLFYSFVAKGQTENFFVNRIDSTNDHFYFESLQRMSRQGNTDSTDEAIGIIVDLSNFDSLKYSAALLQPILSQIDSFSFILFQKTLEDKWKSEALGSNWGGEIINPEKKFIFKNSEAFFYHRHTLIRNTSYDLNTRNIRHNGLVLKKFVIQFSDTKEEWALSFITRGHWVPFHGKAEKVFLMFNKEPNCVCGCPEELYSLDTDIECR
ncbi:MAG: hypothetical protein V4722_00680 [Bacteroidota bacterium]